MLCSIQAAINAGKVKDVYKTAQCLKASCRRLHCHYYHDETDRLPAANFKAQYCIAYKVSLHMCFSAELYTVHVQEHVLRDLVQI